MKLLFIFYLQMRRLNTRDPLYALLNGPSSEAVTFLQDGAKFIARCLRHAQKRVCRAVLGIFPRYCSETHFKLTLCHIWLRGGRAGKYLYPLGSRGLTPLPGSTSLTAGLDLLPGAWGIYKTGSADGDWAFFLWYGR